jgi:serine/threonine-protein kinase
MKFCEFCGRFFDDPELASCPEDGQPLRAMAASDDPLQQLVGQVVDGRFRVLSMLGLGGMGAVYRAMQTSVQREVALKVIRGSASPALAKRFMLEARTTSQLKSIHTVTVFDFGQTPDGLLYLAMELLEGEDLEHVLRRHGRLPWREALRVIDEVALSLEEAHDKGIVHRDLKPSNIYLCKTGSGPPLVKVLDFGVAKLQTNDQPTLTGTGMIVGTPQYMAPEQAHAAATDARTDLYSLGCVLYEMLTGRPPFVADTPLGVLLAHAQQEAPTLETVAPGLDSPPGVQQLVESMLKKPLQARITGARELHQRVAALVRREVTTLSTQTTSELLPSPLNADDLRQSLAATDAGAPRPLDTAGGQPGLRVGASRIKTFAWIGAGVPLAALVAVLVTNGWDVGGPKEAVMNGPAAIQKERPEEPTPPPKAEDPPAAPKPAEVPAPAPVTPAVAPAPVTPAVAPAPPPAAVSKVVIRSEPPGAEVQDAAGKLLGKTPLEIDTATVPQVLKLVRKDYRAAEVTVAAQATGPQPTVKLVKKRTAAVDELANPY